MRLPTAVLFDNDGLLLDTESVWTRAERDLFARRGVEFTLAHKQELVGTPAHVNGQVLAHHLHEPGREAELIAELDALVLAELEQGVETMAGARELIAALDQRGVPVGLVSNSPPHFIALTLELVGMTGTFGAVVSGHEVAEAKPAPDAYLECCRRLAVEPSREVVVLEDSPTGVSAGIAAGLTVIGIPSLEGIELDGADETYGSLAEPELHTRLGLG